MAIANATAWSNVIREVYTPGRLVSTAFFNRTFFDFSSYPFDQLGDGYDPGDGLPKGLFPVIPSKGGDSWNWPVAYSVGAAEAYSEGQGAPAPGNVTWLMAQLAYSGGYYQRSVEISGHAIDNAKDEGAIVEAFSKELSGATKAIVDIINTTFLGSTQLQLAVDSAGTYAGIDRGTYTAWGSSEIAVGGAQSKAALDNMVEALQDNDRGASLDDLMFLCPVNQLTNHSALAGAGAGVPIMTAGGQPLDLGHRVHSHQLIPMIGVPDMTDTEIYLLHRPSVYWVMHRPLTIEPKPSAGDSMKWLLTCSILPVVERPHLCSKSTGVTA